MRYCLSIAFLIFGLCSCENSDLNSTPSKTEKPVETKAESINPDGEPHSGDRYYLQDYANEISLLDSLYGKPVFLFLNKESPYFIVSKNESTNGFNGKDEFGLVDQKGEVILDFNLSKIYNLNHSLKNCLELKSNGKIGLLNIETKDILPPIFEFILPETGAFSNIGYGYLNQQWYRINKDSLLDFKLVDFNPVSSLNNLEYSNKNTDEHFFFNLQVQESYEPTALLTYPSIFEFIYSENLDNKPEDQYFFHFEKTPKFQAKISDKRNQDTATSSFLISLLYEFVEGRGTTIESENLVVYNKLNKNFEKRLRRHEHSVFGACMDSHSRFVNDSILETKFVDSYKNPDSTMGKYFLGNDYEFLKIKPNGKIQTLKTNREFAYTKFVLIDASYFKACFIQLIPNELIVENDAWQSDHLTIEDLNLMRNEILRTMDWYLNQKNGRNILTYSPGTKVNMKT